MREILFRGKRIDNGEWVYGSFCMDALEQKNGLCGVDGFIRRYDADAGKMQMYEVDRETVGQFTGLTDKNGTKIFEGDIVNAKNNKRSCTIVVKFGEYFPKMFYDLLELYSHSLAKQKLLAHGFFGISIEKKEEVILFQSPNVTVIGNIHDNPELLGGEYDGK